MRDDDDNETKYIFCNVNWVEFVPAELNFEIHYQNCKIAVECLAILLRIRQDTSSIFAPGV